MLVSLLFSVQSLLVLKTHMITQTYLTGSRSLTLRVQGRREAGLRKRVVRNGEHNRVHWQHIATPLHDHQRRVLSLSLHKP
jgi:hypothetical protein